MNSTLNFFFKRHTYFRLITLEIPYWYKAPLGSCDLEFGHSVVLYPSQCTSVDIKIKLKERIGFVIVVFYLYKFG